MHSDWYSLTSNDRLLHAGGLNWTYTLGTGLLDPWSIGATSIVLKDNLTISDIPNVIKEFQRNIICCCAGCHRKLLEQNEELEFPSLRHCFSAGEN